MADSKSGILMPENIIFNSIIAMLNLVKTDWEGAEDKEKSLLWAFFKKDVNDQDINFNNQVDYYAQAVDLFVNRPRIQVNMGYNLETADIASIHILLPNESGRFLGIGADENYVEDERYIEDEGTEEEAEYARPIFTNTFDTTYQMMITSSNIFEVLMIYNLLKSGFVSLYENIEFSGLRNPKLGGQDINFQSDLVPPHIFHRSLSLTFFYELSTPRFFREKLIKLFTVTGTAIND